MKKAMCWSAGRLELSTGDGLWEGQWGKAFTESSGLVDRHEVMKGPQASTLNSAQAA